MNAALRLTGNDLARALAACARVRPAKTDARTVVRILPRPAERAARGTP